MPASMTTPGNKRSSVVDVGRMPSGALILYCFLVGTLATLWGYDYGGGNQVEQLPIVMRALDSTYLVNDFFTNASEAYGPRFFFAAFVAGLAHLAPLYFVYLGLTIAGNFLTALVTAMASRRIFQGSQLAAWITAGAVMSLKTFWLGANNTIYRTYLEPNHLAMPFLLVCIGAGLYRRPLLCTLAACVAAVFHPLAGLETGVLMLGVMIAQVILSTGNVNRDLRIDTRLLVLSCLIFLGVAASILLPYMAAERIGDELFIEILAHLRHPHHYLPSTFGLLQFLQAAIFISAIILVWMLCRRLNYISRELSLPLGILCILLFGACLGGFLFVEVIPTRLWTTAQTFRLLYIIKWLGLVVLAGWVGRELESTSDSSGKPAGWIYLLGLMSSLTSLFNAVARMAFIKYKWATNLLGGTLSTMVLSVVILVLLVLQGVDAHQFILFPLFILMALSFYSLRRRYMAVLVNVGVFAVVLILLGLPPLPPSFLNEWVTRPVFTLEDQSGDRIDVAEYARLHTPGDAIFLVPPKLGIFRLVGERAIVVDFKAFPFQDVAMAEWQERLYTCYGAPATSGWDAEVAMTLEYRHIDDDRLRDLQSRYGFSYAVLFRETPTDFPLLVEGETYKIVLVGKGDS